MKNLLAIFVLCFFSIAASAQSNANNDVVQKTDGQEMKGKVVRVSDTDVTFVYAGESAE